MKSPCLTAELPWWAQRVSSSTWQWSRPPRAPHQTAAPQPWKRVASSRPYRQGNRGSQETAEDWWIKITNHKVALNAIGTTGGKLGKSTGFPPCGHNDWLEKPRRISEFLIAFRVFTWVQKEARKYPKRCHTYLLSDRPRLKNHQHHVETWHEQQQNGLMRWAPDGKLAVTATNTLW